MGFDYFPFNMFTFFHILHKMWIFSINMWILCETFHLGECESGTNNKRVWLMCALRHTLNFLFLKIFFPELKKLLLLFQFSRNFFPKIVQTLVNSIIKNYLFNYYFYLSCLWAFRLPPFDKAAATPMRKFEV